MRKYGSLGLLFFVVLFFQSLGQARGPLGLGVVIGDPTGITGKYAFSQRNALQAAVGWDIGDEFTLNVDYLWTYPGFLHVEGAGITGYFGVGGQIHTHDDDHHHHHHHEDQLAVRGPFGLSYLFNTTGIEVFGELALVLTLIDDTDVSIDGGVGVRYFF